MATAEPVGTWEASPPDGMEPPTTRAAGRSSAATRDLSKSTRALAATGRVVSWLAGGAVTLATLSLVGVLVMLSVAPRVGWFRVETVLSGSMRPAFSPGDLLIVAPEPTQTVHVGQVVTYAIPVGDHHVESHRVVHVVKPGVNPVIITKGDANTTADPWHAELRGPTAWKLRMVIPRLGLAIQLLRSPLAHLASVILAPLCFAAIWLRRIWTSPHPT